MRRRLSFLVKDEHMFNEIENVAYRDYKGTFLVFYKRERAGRLFNFRESSSSRYVFDFGEAGGEIATDNLSDIDGPLEAIYRLRLEEAAS